MIKILEKLKKMFRRNKSKTVLIGNTASLEKGFHPEILFLINRPYAEYVSYKEV